VSEKKKRITPKERAKLIEEAINLVTDSLQSHLPYTHEPDKLGANFHQVCVVEYAKVIQILSKLY